jgi:hypothetical protein
LRRLQPLDGIEIRRLQGIQRLAEAYILSIEVRHIRVVSPERRFLLTEL